MIETPTKPCECGKRKFRRSDHIRFCADCAPNKSLAVFHADEDRRRNPELPLPRAPRSAGVSPDSLRAQAAQIRNGAQYADDPRAYRAEMAQADELEARARAADLASPTSDLRLPTSESEVAA